MNHGFHLAKKTHSRYFFLQWVYLWRIKQITNTSVSARFFFSKLRFLSILYSTILQLKSRMNQINKLKKLNNTKVLKIHKISIYLSYLLYRYWQLEIENTQPMWSIAFRANIPTKKPDRKNLKALRIIYVLQCKTHLTLILEVTN